MLVYLSPSGLHVRSTQQWTQCCPHASPAERKRLWRDCRSTINSSRKQNPENHKSKACTVKSCCSVAPQSSALRNCELNATLKRWHRRSEVKKTRPVLQTTSTDAPWIVLDYFCFYCYVCLSSCCKYCVCRVWVIPFELAFEWKTVFSWVAWYGNSGMWFNSLKSVKT